MPGLLSANILSSPTRRRLPLPLRFYRRSSHRAHTSFSATMASLSPLAQHIRAESARWAAHPPPYQRDSPASPSSTVSSFRDDASLFSTSRRSSVSSVASSDADDVVHAQHQLQPHDTNGAPIRMFTSLNAAAAASVASIYAASGEAPRRLVTPGKLYENEEDDDEIIEYDEDESVVATG
jgi:hypothetical protein